MPEISYAHTTEPASLWEEIRQGVFHLHAGVCVMWKCVCRWRNVAVSCLDVFRLYI